MLSLNELEREAYQRGEMDKVQILHAALEVIDAEIDFDEAREDIWREGYLTAMQEMRVAVEEIDRNSGDEQALKISIQRALDSLEY